MNVLMMCLREDIERVKTGSKLVPQRWGRGAKTGCARSPSGLGLRLERMDPDDEVCLCFHVSLRKIRGFLEREDPAVASLISECLGAGTGCGWCVPFLKHLHKQHACGGSVELRVSPEQYAKSRLTYHRTNEREIGPPAERGDEGGAAGFGEC